MSAASRWRVGKHGYKCYKAATFLLAQGVDPRTIMETLGHSQISLTRTSWNRMFGSPASCRSRLKAVMTAHGPKGGADPAREHKAALTPR